MNRRNRIQILFQRGNEYCAQIVFAAMVRSFSASQVEKFRLGDGCDPAAVTVLIQPGEIDRSRWRQLTQPGNKIIVFGNIGSGLSAELGIVCAALPPEATEWDKVSPTLSAPFDISPMAIRYAPVAGLTDRTPSGGRYLCRYDFTDEWNNHGYGRIATNAGPWALCQQAVGAGATPVAEVTDPAGHRQTLYASVTDFPQVSVLWFNRPVGPLDSGEWTVVEEFVAGYRAEQLVCLPCLEELPVGAAAIVTPRLDCDQAIGSAGLLLDLYGDYRIPLSLAVLTGLPLTPSDLDLLKRAVELGGSLHSHSHSHAPDWGGSYEAALAELRGSAAWLEQQFPGRGFGGTAVSPFHQNPVFAVQAMHDAGYIGFAGGIIRNDPEYLLGRAGQVPLVDGPLVSLSQQCMLHGDCYHRYGNSVQPYRECFQHCRQAGSFFGYLDHPFSEEYQYGWRDEPERLSAHESLIRAIQSEPGVAWWNLQQCLEYLKLRNRIGVEWISADDWQQTGDASTASFGWRWRGAVCREKSYRSR